MVDVINMNETQRLDYIFNDHEDEPITNRFGWFEALLGDIQTFVNTVQTSPHLVEGGGNLSIPILACTGLELVSALYVGDTRYLSGRAYNAEDNVDRFFQHFFPSHARRIPRLIWDGVRNGVDHLFIPNSIKYSQNRYVFFSFYVEDAANPSNVTKDNNNNNVVIRINSIEFYRTLRTAIEDYRNELQNNADVQRRFIIAWDSIKPKDITRQHQKMGEVSYLLSELNQRDTIDLFQ